MDLSLSQSNNPSCLEFDHIIIHRDLSYVRLDDDVITDQSRWIDKPRIFGPLNDIRPGLCGDFSFNCL
jgi:hypothetical protein